MLDVYQTYIDHSGKCIYHIFFLQRGDIIGSIARNTVGDIGKQLGEIGYFEDLIQREEL